MFKKLTLLFCLALCCAVLLGVPYAQGQKVFDWSKREYNDVLKLENYKVKLYFFVDYVHVRVEVSLKNTSKSTISEGYVSLPEYKFSRLGRYQGNVFQPAIATFFGGKPFEVEAEHRVSNVLAIKDVQPDKLFQFEYEYYERVDKNGAFELEFPAQEATRWYLELTGHGKAPEIKGALAQEIQLESLQDTWSGTWRESGFSPGKLSLHFKEKLPNVFGGRGRYSRKRYFFTALQLPERTLESPKKIGIIWDNSSLSNTQDYRLKKEAIENILQTFPNAELALYPLATLNEVPKKQVFKNNSELEEVLSSFAEGGFPYWEKVLQEIDGDRIVVLSSGRMLPYLEENLSKIETPVFWFSTSSNSLAPKFKHWISKTGGRSFDLREATQAVLTKTLNTAYFFPDSLVYNQQKLRALTLRGNGDGTLQLAGELVEASEIALHFRGGAKPQTQHIAPAASPLGFLAEELWVMDKIKAMEERFIANFSEIDFYLKRYNLPSYYSAWAFPENIESYNALSVSPPTAWFKAYQVKLGDAPQKEKATSEELLELFSNWQNTTYAPATQPASEEFVSLKKSVLAYLQKRGESSSPITFVLDAGDGLPLSLAKSFNPTEQDYENALLALRKDEPGALSDAWRGHPQALTWLLAQKEGSAAQRIKEDFLSRFNTNVRLLSYFIFSSPSSEQASSPEAHIQQFLGNHPAHPQFGLPTVSNPDLEAVQRIFMQNAAAPALRFAALLKLQHAQAQGKKVDLPTLAVQWPDPKPLDLFVRVRTFAGGSRALPRLHLPNGEKITPEDGLSKSGALCLPLADYPLSAHAFLIQRAENGTYRLEFPTRQMMQSHVLPATIALEVTRNYGRKNQETKHVQLDLASEGEMDSLLRYTFSVGNQGETIAKNVISWQLPQATSLLASASGELWAFGPEVQRWSLQTQERTGNYAWPGGEVRQAFLLKNKYLYAVEEKNGSFVLALRLASSGKLLQEHFLGKVAPLSARVEGERLVLLLPEGIYSFSPNSPEPLQEGNFDVAVQAGASGAKVLVLFFEQDLLLMDKQTGKSLYTESFEELLDIKLRENIATLLFTKNDVIQLRAMNVETGQVLWQKSLETPYEGLAPFLRIAGNAKFFVWALPNADKAYVESLYSGERISTIPLKGALKDVFLEDENFYFLLDNSGEIYRYKITDLPSDTYTSSEAILGADASYSGDWVLLNQVEKNEILHKEEASNFVLDEARSLNFAEANAQGKTARWWRFRDEDALCYATKEGHLGITAFNAEKSVALEAFNAWGKLQSFAKEARLALDSAGEFVLCATKTQIRVLALGQFLRESQKSPEKGNKFLTHKKFMRTFSCAELSSQLSEVWRMKGSLPEHFWLQDLKGALWYFDAARGKVERVGTLLSNDAPWAEKGEALAWLGADGSLNYRPNLSAATQRWPLRGKRFIDLKFNQGKENSIFALTTEGEVFEFWPDKPWPNSTLRRSPGAREILQSEKGKLLMLNGSRSIKFWETE